MKKILFVIATFFIWSAFSQNQANNWYFGANAGLNFNTEPPTILLDGELWTNEGCSTISDLNGELLFYTDGQLVYDKTHNVMPEHFNSGVLFGDSSSTNSALIVPKPNDENIHYIITVDVDAGVQGLRYTEVDLSLNNGLGDITNNINQPLHTPVTEKLSALHIDDEGITWVVAHKWESNEFIAYRIDENGVDINPIVSATGQFLGGELRETRGQMKISPNGLRLAMVNEFSNTVQLFNFNPLTGEISNPMTIMDLELDDPLGIQALYGVEFSPNSELLYVSQRSTGVYQFNLALGSTQEIIDSETTVVDTEDQPFYMGMQLAKNNKIYVARYGATEIDVIEQPNTIGLGCNYTIGAQSLGGEISFAGLPQLAITIPQTNEIIYESTCEENTYEFTLLRDVDSVIWDFGDPQSNAQNTSNDLVALHTFSQPGTYVVTATTLVNGYTLEYTTELTVEESISYNEPINVFVCDDNANDGIEMFDLSVQNAIILQGLDSAEYTINYFLSYNDAFEGINAINENYENISNPQNIFVRVEEITTACFEIFDFVIEVIPKPIIDLPNEIWICPNDEVVLTVSSGYDQYLWSTGETTNEITVTQPGEYQIMVTNAINDIGCETTQTVTVILSDVPQQIEVEVLSGNFNNYDIVINADGSGIYEYSLDGINYQQSNYFENVGPEHTVVYVRDSNGCGVISTELDLLHYPLFFTPNDDGYNDTWQIINGYLEPNSQVYIFDRYGKLLKVMTTSSLGWDGTYNGNAMPSNTYWFSLSRMDGQEYHGYFALKR